MNLKDQILGLICIILWCVNFPALSLISAQLSPVQITALRLALPGIAAIYFFPFPRRYFWKIFFLGLGYFSAPLVLTTFALRDIHPTIVVIVTNFEIIFVLFAERLFFKTNVKRSEMIGIFLSFFGANLILISPEITIENFLALFMALAAALAYAITGFNVKKIPISSAEMTLWSAGIGCLQCIAFSILFESPSVLSIPSMPVHFWGVIFLSAATTTIAFWIWNALLIRNPVYQVSSFVLLIPLATFIASMIIIKRPLETKALIGGFLCLTGPAIPYLNQKISANFSSKKSKKENLNSSSKKSRWES